MTEARDKPDHQRPEHPAFWDKRFGEGVTPWDAGSVPAVLAAYMEACTEAPGRVLIPGCGSAHEAAFFDRLGWEVTALDFSAAAIEAARRNLGDWGGSLQQEDFFAHAPAAPYGLVYERAFLCALPRKIWAGYGETMARLVAPGGSLIGFFFLGDEPKGPPFGIRREALDDLLSPYFELQTDEAVADSLPAFAGGERWMVWRRR